jgi:hypothetical protein
MRGYTMVLVGAVFASSLLTFAAQARGQVVSNGDRFGAGGRYISVGGRSDERVSSLRYGAVREVVGIGRGAFSGNMKVSFQAARSIG